VILRHFSSLDRRNDQSSTTAQKIVLPKSSAANKTAELSFLPPRQIRHTAANKAAVVREKGHAIRGQKTKNYQTNPFCYKA
jgi:hypothetical protein